MVPVHSFCVQDNYDNDYQGMVKTTKICFKDPWNQATSAKLSYCYIKIPSTKLIILISISMYVSKQMLVSYSSYNK